MARVAFALLLLFAARAHAGDDLRAIYAHAKRLKDEHRKEYAAKQAARFADTTDAKDQIYVGYLWSWAGEWDRAARAFRAYLRGAGPKARNRRTAMVERARMLIESGRWDDVPEAVQQYRDEFSGTRHVGRMLFYLGRARRVQGDAERAHEAFRLAARAGHDLSGYEVADALVQLGRYDEARKAAAEFGDGSARFAALTTALPAFGKKLPKLDLDYWTGRELARSELFAKPALYGFWSSKAGRVRHTIHAAMNGWAEAFGSRLHVIGPTVYARFDPHEMRTEEEMSPDEERGLVSAWHEQYGLRYPLVLVGDGRLHDLCGVDTERPTLPAFALSDRKGRLRYVRVGGSDWALEAVEAMVKRLVAEDSD